MGFLEWRDWRAESICEREDMKLWDVEEGDGFAEVGGRERERFWEEPGSIKAATTQSQRGESGWAGLPGGRCLGQEIRGWKITEGP